MPDSSDLPKESGGFLAPPSPRIGSMCTGYGGLDLAISDVLGGRTVWTAELDRFARLVTEARLSVPNHGDIKTTDWSNVEPIDVLTAGYPCQPFSQAGKRQGADDPRHLWPAVRDAIRHLRPRLVVLENVQGHLRLGFQEVLGDLAALGFDAEWTLLRASEVGACHARARLFVVASDPSGERRWEVARGARSGEEPLRQLDQDVHHLPVGDGEAGSDPWGVLTQAVAHTDRQGRQGARPAVEDGGDGSADRRCSAVLWGPYEAAVRRHERVFGRPAPAPLDTEQRLNVRFVEWMMMLPEGWVTDLVSRNQAMKILGNGVVPRQAAEAVNHLIGRLTAEEAAA